MSAANSCSRSCAQPASRSVTARRGPSDTASDPEDPIPTNAIYANGDPIPDPSGTGYLTYEV